MKYTNQKPLVVAFLSVIVLSGVLIAKNITFSETSDVMQTIQRAIQNFDQIPAERKENLKELARYIQSKAGAGEEAKLIFICTHNSRRSHMSQLWASVAADHYGIPDVQTYSGGTEATAFNPRAVAALERAGFDIEKITDGENPHYRIRYDKDAPFQEAFSKKYDDPVNPRKDFAAIMTCSQADEACPFVPGATFRIAIPYEDPKEADGTPQEAARYDERSQQIATEMLFCFSQITLK